jgi:hypothetical protein
MERSFGAFAVEVILPGPVRVEAAVAALRGGVLEIVLPRVEDRRGRAHAVPTPGGVGGFHAAIQFALTSLLDVDLPTATAFALLHHVVCFVPITILGLSYLAAVGLSLSRVRALEEASAEGIGER